MHDRAQNVTQTRTAIARPWRAAFLAALRTTGNVRRACEACEIARRTAYTLRQDDPTFAQAWDEAQEDFSDLLEEEAVRRAIGTREIVIHQGKPCGVWILDGQIVTETTPHAKLVPLYENRYSDSLIQFELRGRRRHKYDPPKEAPAAPDAAQGETASEVLADAYAEEVAAGRVAGIKTAGDARPGEGGACVDTDQSAPGGGVRESGG